MEKKEQSFSNHPYPFSLCRESRDASDKASGLKNTHTKKTSTYSSK
jgi:hypothetical protein